MHGLCFRMLFHLRGETMVRGQPPGCIIYTIPNVVFTDAYQAELRKASANSPEIYVLASSTGDYSKLEPPPTSAWTNHMLLKWGALQMSRLAAQAGGETNESGISKRALAFAEIALPLVRHAQSVEPTNGTYWLAEAAVQFARKDDAAALAALRIAASNNVWRADMENTFTNMISLFLKAGLSKLDAVTAANLLSPTTSTLWLQTVIRHNFGRLMEAAVRRSDDEEFNRLFQLLVELRRASWDERSFEFLNMFRNSLSRDGLEDAMAVRIGIVIPPEPDRYDAESRIREKLRSQAFQDYLNRYGTVETFARFRGQADGNNTIRSLRKQLVRVHTDSLMLKWAISSTMGLFASLVLALLIVGVLSELPFLGLQGSARAFGYWPCGWRFWLTTVAAVALGTFVFTDVQLGLGLYTRGGLQLVSEPEHMSPRCEAFITALVICVIWFAALLSVRRTSKKPIHTWPFVIGLAALYCIVVIVAGIFRERTVEIVQSALF